MDSPDHAFLRDRAVRLHDMKGITGFSGKLISPERLRESPPGVMVNLGLVEPRPLDAERLHPRRQLTRLRSPVLRSVSGIHPRCSLAAEISARLRGTGSALRTGPYSGSKPEPITSSSICASSVRVVSVPLPILNAPAVP